MIRKPTTRHIVTGEISKGLLIMADNLQFYHGLVDNFDEFKIRKYHKNDANMDYVIYLTDNLGWAI